MKRSNILTKKELQQLQERISWAEYEREVLYKSLLSQTKKPNSKTKHA